MSLIFVKPHIYFRFVELVLNGKMLQETDLNPEKLLPSPYLVKSEPLLSTTEVMFPMHTSKLP